MVNLYQMENVADPSQLATQNLLANLPDMEVQ